MGEAVAAGWGRFLKEDKQIGWLVRAEWSENGMSFPELDTEIPSKASTISEDGKIVYLPTAKDKDTSGAWIFGREHPFNPVEHRLLDSACYIVESLLEKKGLQKEYQHQKIIPQEGASSGKFPNIIGRSAAMEKVFLNIERIAQSTAPVLIKGKSGTGKELSARAIHDLSPRSEKNFVAQNCAALPDALLESELFGYRKGAFTGASADKPGLFEVADGGTIFLDEIVDASPAVQAKLLRVVEEGEIRRVGDTQSRKNNVRIISATSCDLIEQVQRGKLREDLFYRLNVVRIELPSLLERREDIPLLAEHFLQKICERDAKQILGFSQETVNSLCAYPWPGNVRELQNEIERCVATSAPGRLIDVEDLSPSVRGLEDQVARSDGSLQQMLTHIEQIALQDTLQRCEGNISRAARKLGLSRAGLQRKMKRYGMRKPT